MQSRSSYQLTDNFYSAVNREANHLKKSPSFSGVARGLKGRGQPPQWKKLMSEKLSNLQ